MSLIRFIRYESKDGRRRAEITHTPGTPGTPWWICQYVRTGYSWQKAEHWHVEKLKFAQARARCWTT